MNFLLSIDIPAQCIKLLGISLEIILPNNIGIGII